MLYVNDVQEGDQMKSIEEEKRKAQPHIKEGVKVHIVAARWLKPLETLTYRYELEERLVVLNAVARSVVDARRGRHPDYVFTYRGNKLDCMNKTAWQNARRHAAKKYKERFGKDVPWAFEHVRIHDLKHTFGRRLRASRRRLVSQGKNQKPGTRPESLSPCTSPYRRTGAVAPCSGSDRGNT